jgi:hypothetical protein
MGVFFPCAGSKEINSLKGEIVFPCPDFYLPFIGK